MDAFRAVSLIPAGPPLADVWLVAPNVMVTVCVALAGALAVWYYRESSMLRQRRAIRALMALAEDVVSAATPSEMARAVSSVLPHLFQASSASVLLYDRTAQELRLVLLDGGVEASGIRVDSPVGTLMSAAALCFRNRALLAIPNTRRSPLLEPEAGNLPAAALFVPMLNRGEPLGVVSLMFSSQREFGKEDQAAIQHVANQIATSLKLQEQQHMREQLLRSEKVAATAQLMSGVAGELTVPLQAIRNLAVNDPAARPDAALSAIAWEAERAHGILQRLSTFTDREAAGPERVDVAQIVGALLEFRRHEWSSRGIDWRSELPTSALPALAMPRHLEQVILDLLIRAEAAAERTPRKALRLGGRMAGDIVVASIAFSCSPDNEEGNDLENVLGPGLQVCRTVLESMGGTLEVAHQDGDCRIDVHLPAAGESRPATHSRPARRSSRTLTMLIVEPDPSVQRRLMALLAVRGHRAVPVGAAEEGLDMLHRLRFDAVICGVRLPHMNWTEFHAKARGRTRHFVLLTDAPDPELARGFKPGEGTLLNRALEPDDVHRALADIETP